MTENEYIATKSLIQFQILNYLAMAGLVIKWFQEAYNIKK